MSLPNIIPNDCERCNAKDVIITRSLIKDEWICLECFNKEGKGSKEILKDFKEKVLKNKAKMERTDDSLDITDDMIYEDY